MVNWSAISIPLKSSSHFQQPLKPIPAPKIENSKQLRSQMSFSADSYWPEGAVLGVWCSPCTCCQRGLTQRAAVTQISTDFPLLCYKKQHDTTISNFHKDTGQSSGQACLMSTGLQFIAVVMQLNRCICNCNSERQGESDVGFRSLGSEVISHHPKGKTESWLEVGHSACFYIQPSYTSVLSHGGCLGLPPPKGVCHQSVLWYAGDPLRVD